MSTRTLVPLCARAVGLACLVQALPAQQAAYPHGAVSYPPGASPIVRVGQADDDARAEFYLATDGRLALFDSFEAGAPGATLDSLTFSYTARALAVGDLNGDGLADAVVTSTQSPSAPFGEQFVALVEPSDGSLIKLPLDGGSAAHGAALADFDGDGILDLVLLRYWQDRLAFRPGLGDGQFEVGTTRSLPPDRFDVAVGDFDGDGHLDVMAYGPTLPWADVCFGNGNGTFQPAQPVSTMLPITGLAVGDVDGDGLDDVVCTHSSGVRVLAGQGDGSFAIHPVQHAALELSPPVLADVDRDGALDLLGGATHVLLGDGAGAFAWHADTLIGPVDVTADTDGDGAVDLVGTWSGALFVSRGDGLGGFEGDVSATTLLPTGTSHTVDALAADMNADGIDDLVVFISFPEFQIIVGLHDGQGGFSGTWVTDVPGLALNGGELEAVDFDQDGWMDLVLHTTGQYRLLLNDQTGLSIADIAPSGTPGGDFAVGDVDGDGLADVVGTGNTLTLGVHLGQAGGGLTQGITFEAVNADDLHLADLDCDGHLDLVSSEGYPSLARAVVLRRGDGTGGFAAPTIEVAQVSIDTALGDIDEDGILDIAYRPVALADEIWVQLGNCNGFEASITKHSLPGLDPSTLDESLDLADIDGDGHLDLVRPGKRLGMALGEGNGSFAQEQQFATADEPVLLGLTAGGWAALAQFVDEDAFVQLPLPASPWTGLGQGLAGAGGVPSLLAAGDLVGGAPTTFELTGAAPSALTYWILGFAQLDAPFKGGVLVPDPSSPALVAPLATSAAGAITLAFPWPLGVPAGVEIVVQQWIQDPAGPLGWTASNATSGVTP